MPDYGDDRGFGPSKSSNNFGGGNKNSQTHNSQGTAYSGKLADFMGARNAPPSVSYNTQSIVQERGGLSHRSVSPNDLAEMAGMMQGLNRQGNNADVNRAMESAYGRSTTPAENRGVLGSYNLGMGQNETTGMGVMDSLKYNTIDQPGFMDAVKGMGIGLLGNAIAPGLGTVLGLLNRDTKAKNVDLAKVNKVDNFDNKNNKILNYGS